MSRNYSVEAIKPHDDLWTQMKAVYDACEAANVPIPDQVDEYFNHEEPDERGVAIDVECKEWSDGPGGYRGGYEVDLTKLPKDVKILRFVISS